MMSIYAIGFVAVFAIFGLMYLHAWRIRDRLDLDEGEQLGALSMVANCGVMVGVGRCL